MTAPRPTPARSAGLLATTEDTRGYSERDCFPPEAEGSKISIPKTETADFIDTAASPDDFCFFLFQIDHQNTTKNKKEARFGELGKKKASMDR